MIEPAMLVLGDEPASLDELRATLDRRYGLVLSSLRRLDNCGSGIALPMLAADDRSVAIVCGLAAMLDTGGAAFLAITQRLNPTAKRVVIVPQGGPSAPSLRVPDLSLQDQYVARFCGR